MNVTRTTLRVTQIGEFIRHNSCERRFKLGLNNSSIPRSLPFFARFLNSLDPVLQEAGKMREDEWANSLVKEGYHNLSDSTGFSLIRGRKVVSWSEFITKLNTLQIGQKAFWREVEVEMTLNSFDVKGQIDFIVLFWEGNKPKLRIVECKSSRRDRTYHRIQIALYKMAVNQLLEIPHVFCAGQHITDHDTEYVVARIDEGTNKSQDILDLSPLDLDMEEADLKHLLAIDGPLDYIVQSDVDNLSYQIDQKCDGCTFNVDCLPESARQRRLELLSLPTSTIRVLRAAGINTIDALADLDLTGIQAVTIRNSLGFNENLEHIKLRAVARKQLLPKGIDDPDDYPVQPLPNTGDGQLPNHILDGLPLVRVYLSVDYDYAENRIGALCAHVTKSEYQMHTGFMNTGAGYKPDPDVQERIETGRDAENKPIHDFRNVQGDNIIKVISSPWSGNYVLDSGSEKEIIQSFFSELINAISSVAQTNQAPIHFYVWSRSEMTQLVEACTRVSSKLLSTLRQLLGCRESLEQLLFSSLRDELSRRFGLGWTGKGMTVISSLTWFGRRYHWTRRIDGQIVELDRAFTQDLFDFKSTIDYMPNGDWAKPNTPGALSHRFEIRSRFNDSLPAPYWRAFWGELPGPNDPQLDRNVAKAIERYNEAYKPNYLKQYLQARLHALRWMEEGVRFKNPSITKLLMNIPELKRFSLGISNAAQAGIDFLRLDQHVKVANWVVDNMQPPAIRVPTGRTLPLRNVTTDSSGIIQGIIDTQAYELSLESFEARSLFAVGAFVRLSPCSDNPGQGQTLRQLTNGGVTCQVSSIDWGTGLVSMALRFGRPNTYTLNSTYSTPDFLNAVLDESVTDFVARGVEARLRSNRGTYTHSWFDPEQPTVPAQQAIDSTLQLQIENFINSYQYATGRQLQPDQIMAVLTGLNTRVHLLQGPPGTGKTMTASVAVLTRIWARHTTGNVIFIAAHTHNAVDNLLERIDNIQASFRAHAVSSGINIPSVQLLKVHSSNISDLTGGSVIDIVANSSTREINKHRRTSVLVIGGTTNALLKMVNSVSASANYSNLVNGFQADALIVDEASMMVFPHFLALATTLSENGEIMLSGDHRQLSPILAHDWEHEDRPPALLYQPFASAYDAVRNLMRLPAIAQDIARVTYSALNFSFRLPPLIRDLIARLYLRDAIQLEGLNRPLRSDSRGQNDSWDSVWANDTGLYLVLHSERESRQSNETEAEIIRMIVEAAPALQDESVAVITPHRAQRTLLQTRLSAYTTAPNQPIGVIDTVNRLQGDEKPIIIVSATASDPASISNNVEFILELNRANVAFSRTQDRLIVVCSESLINHIPVEFDQYQDTLLWKSLRELCKVTVAEETVNSVSIRILTPDFDGDNPSVNLQT